MKTWIQLNAIMDKSCISEDDQELVRDFLFSFSFSKRQTLLGVLIGFEEKLEFFVNLIKYKKELRNSLSKELTDKILDIEKEEFEILIKALKV